MKNSRFIPVLMLLGVLALIGTFVIGDSYHPGPQDERYDTSIAVTITDNNGTATWANVVGWARLTSVGVALTDSLTDSTNTIQVIRAEGVTEDIAVIEGDGSSFRWTALNRNDVVLRDGDTVAIGMTVITNGGGVAYLNMDL